MLNTKTMVQKISLIGFILLVSGCLASNPPQINDNKTLYKNPNPEIEKLHVRAYNYDLGIGVKQNRVKANALYLKAAKAGDPRSMMNYAINLNSGVGVKKNNSAAFCWINKARFATQKSRDMKLKWRVRGVFDEIKKSILPREEAKARKNC